MQYMISFLRKSSHLFPRVCCRCSQFIFFISRVGSRSSKKDASGSLWFCCRFYNGFCSDGSAGRNGGQFSAGISDSSEYRLRSGGNLSLD